MTGRRQIPPRKAMRYWWVLEDRILEKPVDHPSPRELAGLVERALRAGGAPEKVWIYIGRRLRDEIHLGDGGRPKDTLSEQWRKEYRRQIHCRDIEQRRRRYALVRLTKPRSKKVRSRHAPPRLAQTIVLRGSPTEFGHWARAKGGTWKLRSPLDYAFRRVALDSGIEEQELRRWWKGREKHSTLP